MKNIVFIWIILFSILQSKPVQETIFSNNYLLNKEKKSDLLNFRYNNFLCQNKKLKSVINPERKERKGIIFQPSVIYINNNQTKLIFSYNPEGKCTETIEQIDSLGNWVLKSRTTYTYNSAGDIQQEQFITTDLFTVSYKKDYLYDTSGNLVALLTQNLENNNWVEVFRESYTYDLQNNLLHKLIESYGNSTWYQTIQYWFTYDENNNMITELFQINESGIWVDEEQLIYSYNNLGQLITLVFQSRTNTGLKPRWRDNYQYNQNNRLIFCLTEYFSNDIWENWLRTTYSIDIYNNLITILEEEFNNNWNNFRKTTYTYDIYANITSILIEQFWETNNWKTDSFLTYNYVNNNAIKGGYEVLSTTIGTIEMFFNNMHDSVILMANNFTAEYTQFTDVKDELNNSLVFMLNQNYPNPFNPSTNINFTLPNSEFVTLKIYDILGEEVTTLINEEMIAGNYTKIWDAKNLSSGVYFYKLTAGKFSETKKMILVR